MTHPFVNLLRLVVVGMVAWFVLSLTWNAITGIPEVQEATAGLIMEASVKPEVTPEIYVTEHALFQHPEGEAVNRCRTENGIYQTFRDRKDPRTYYWVCQMSEGKYKGKWGLQVILYISGKITILSSFIPGDGSQNAVMIKLNSLATRWTQELK